MPRLCSILAAVMLGGVLVMLPPSTAQANDCNPATQESELDHMPWGQERMAPERVWPLVRGEGITVAVIDSGVSDAHPVLSGKVAYGDDYTDQIGHQDEDAPTGADCDIVGHGTSIAGVIAGSEDPDSPFTGMAPDADIFSIRVMQDMQGIQGDEVPQVIAAAIREAVDEGVDVINLSVQVTDHSALEEAVDYAADNDVIMVAAAGNQGGEDGSNDPMYPAAYENDAILAVAAVDPAGEPEGSSNTGAYLDLAAPGVEIVGPGPEGEGYTGGEAATGTSFATAFVTGTAVLTRDRYPDLEPGQVADRLRATAQSPPGGWHPTVGFGTVNPYRAVTADLGKSELTQTMPGPNLELSADKQALPRVAAGVLLGAAIFIAVAVGAGRAVVPRVWAKRQARRLARG